MEEVVKLFKKYEPIKSIYEDDDNYYCFPEVKDGEEPVVVIYNKEFNELKRLFFYEFPKIGINIKLIYGDELL